MTSRPGSGIPATSPGGTTLGDHVLGQLRRLCATVGLGEADTELYGQVLIDSLAGAAHRPLSLPPASPTFLSDDHTPVEFSLASTPDSAPALRVLVEPGWAHSDMVDSGRAGLAAIRAMGARWGFATDQLDVVADLFFPAAAQGPLALWYAFDLRAGGVPGVKVYLNPSASGPESAARTVHKALRRLGYGQAFEQLPPAAGYPFLALDLGAWTSPRVKVYVKHARMSSDYACALSRTSGATAADIRYFFHAAAGSLEPSERGGNDTLRLVGRPALTCHSFTDGDSNPSGFTLHIPVRDYVRDDEEALARATALLTRAGMDPTVLNRSLGALTQRTLADGVGLIAYLALVYERNRPPRITTYLSSEAYRVRPPGAVPARHLDACATHTERPGPRAPGRRPRQPAHRTGGIHVEPYRIKVVEPLAFTTREEREAALKRVAYNPFELRADEVTIDLLSDSGTGAISADQLAAGMQGDESYAGSRSFYRWHEVVSELTGYPHILPAHQGRAAERILFSSLLQPGSSVLSNTHFDTTRANVELTGCTAYDLPCAEAKDLDSDFPFKGNIDLIALEQALENADQTPVAAVLMTITNNGGGGQPVSMDNLHRTAELCRRHNVPMILDAARFAENAWLVTQREPGYGDRTPRQVAEEAFRLADGCVMSAKKDGIVHIGGFIGLKDAELAERCEGLLIATEGFTTYGGLSGRDLDMMARGLLEVTEPAYLAERADIAAYLAARIREAGADIVEPAGLHALYVNAGRLLPHLPPHQYPGTALVCELYLRGGIRSAELGSLYLGQEDEHGNPVKTAPYELVRLALPRRVYTRSHYDHVAATLADIAKNPESVRGYRVTSQSPILRHFSIKLEPVKPRD